MKRIMAAALAVVACVALGIFVLISRPSRLDGPAPNWRGIIPGQTTTEDVIRILGEPEKKWACVIGGDTLPIRINGLMKCITGNIVYWYPETPIPNQPMGTHEIHLAGGKVVSVLEDYSAYVHDAQITVPQFIEQMGKASEILWSRRSPHNRILLYCEKGIMAHAGIETIQVMVYFEPMTTEDCVKEFPNEVDVVNPFPDSDVKGPLNLWTTLEVSIK